jgi:hypothetical protein
VKLCLLIHSSSECSLGDFVFLNNVDNSAPTRESIPVHSLYDRIEEIRSKSVGLQTDMTLFFVTKEPTFSNACEIVSKRSSGPRLGSHSASAIPYSFEDAVPDTTKSYTKHNYQLRYREILTNDLLPTFAKLRHPIRSAAAMKGSPSASSPEEMQRSM